MKSPAELSSRLAREWQQADKREQRLLGEGVWPLRLGIGRPTARQVTAEIAAVREHVRAWRGETVGEVNWQAVNFRSTGGALQLPVTWLIADAEQWVAAASDLEVKSEYHTFSTLVAACDPQFHHYLLRRRPWRQAPVAEVQLACELARYLQPGMLEGVPLRAFPFPGVDSKFFERNTRLMEQLLDIRFDGTASALGLAEFLDAADESGQWLLVVDLDGDILPYRQMRIRHSDLQRQPLPADNIVLVENERCHHQLPVMADTIAILGAGLNLGWLAARWLAQRRIAYWGDIDTWGLLMLATARSHQPQLTALLMDESVLDSAADAAVAEPVTAGDELPALLVADERRLYKRLLDADRGRLEQERLPIASVAAAMREWLAAK